MAGIRKRSWKDSKGKLKYCYEITYYINGELKRKSGYKTRQEAQAALPDVTNSFNTNITFKELTDEYMEKHCKIHCKKTTYSLYNSYLKVNLVKLKNKRIKDFSLRDFNNLIFEFKTQNLSNKTINNIIIYLKSIFNYAIDNEMISKNPISKIKKLPSEKKKINFLTEDQVLVFLKTAKIVTPDYYVLFYTAIHTGMRRGELLGLEWQDIDFNKNEISINKQWYQSEVSTTKTTNSTRIIKIPNSLTELLREHKRKRKNLSRIVFCNSKGQHLHTWNMTERYFKKVLRKMQEDSRIYTLNLDSLKFHDLRHTYASLMLSKGAPIKFVQEQMGHSSSKVTLDIYNHIMPKESEYARNILENIHKYEQNMSIEN